MKYSIGLLSLWLMGIVVAEPIQITDSNGKLSFESPPQRVVVINWTLTEQIITLGIEPVGVADVEEYRERVVRPTLNENVVDVGSRIAPNLNTIRSLKPDAIIVGYSQRPLIRTLSNIAPVVYFKNFSRRYNNAQKADERLSELARLFNKEAQAESVLRQRDTAIKNLRQQLSQSLGAELPDVTVMVIENERHAWTFGDNSMPQYALKELGITPAFKQKPTQFGVQKTAVNDLQTIEGCFLFISYDDFNPLDSLSWQQSRAMQSKCFLQLPRTSLYGGALSLQYLAENIVKTLSQKSPPEK